MDDDSNRIWYNHRFVEDDWNYTATHTIKPSSSSSSLLCIGNNNISNNSTMVPSMPCTYPNGTDFNATTKHTLPPNYYGNTSTNNSRDTTEGIIVGAISSASMITSLLLSKYLYRRYKASTTAAQQDYDVSTSIHSNLSHHRHRHNPITTETITKQTEINVQEEYTKLEASLCSMYVMEHNSEFCHHRYYHHDILVDDAQHKINFENDDVIDNQQYTYDIESYGDEHIILYDTKDSFININKQSQTNVLNSSVHSITTSCSSTNIGCSCNNSTCIDDDDDMTILHDHNECPICLDNFHIGQIVSIPPSLCSCQHIFHHICIKEWLLKNDTCPSCRQVFFNDDIDNDENRNHNNIIVIDHNDDENYTDNKTITSESVMKKNDDDNNDMIMFYCIRHGISYCLPPKSSINNINMNMNHSIMISSPSPPLSRGNSSMIDNNLKNQVRHNQNIISVPTPPELSNLRIQHELPIILSTSSKQQQHIDQDDDIPVHNNNDTINNDHQGGATISNGTTSTDQYIQYYL